MARIGVDELEAVCGVDLEELETSLPESKWCRFLA